MKEPVTHSLSTDVKDLTILAGRMSREPIQEAVRTYKQMRDYQDWIKSELETLSKAIDQARQETLPQMFKESGMTSIAVDGYRFTISETVRASIPGETKPEAYQWLRDNKLEALIIETVNASTLAAQARKMLEDGETLPEELFKVYIMPNVSVTKVNNRSNADG